MKQYKNLRTGEVATEHGSVEGGLFLLKEDGDFLDTEHGDILQIIEE